MHDQDLEVMRNAIDVQKRVGTVMAAACDRLQEAGLADAAALLREAGVHLGRARRALSSIADRSLADTQPIAMASERPLLTTPEQDLVEELVSRGWRFKESQIPVTTDGPSPEKIHARQLHHSRRAR